MKRRIQQGFTLIQTIDRCSDHQHPNRSLLPAYQDYTIRSEDQRSAVIADLSKSQIAESTTIS